MKLERRIRFTLSSSWFYGLVNNKLKIHIANLSESQTPKEKNKKQKTPKEINKMLFIWNVFLYCVRDKLFVTQTVCWPK